MAAKEISVKTYVVDIGFGVGIAHGYATLGSIGYAGRLQYSVTGKVANLASRLCDRALKQVDQALSRFEPLQMKDYTR